VLYVNLLFRVLTLAVVASCASPSVDAGSKQRPAPRLPDVRNPSGACVAPPGNGARPGHGPGEARYLPDCKPPLRREYYRVFAQSEQLAFMVPRPDDAAPTRALCASEAQGSPLRVLFDRYTLCSAVADVARVNAMTPADAMAIGHALHERMRFSAVGGDVRPFPYADDMLAVCDAEPALAQGALAERCAYERDLARRAAEGPIAEPYRLPPDPEGPPLAAALNKLYGIASE